MLNILSLPRQGHFVTENKSITKHFKRTKCYLVVCPEGINQYLRGRFFWKLATLVSKYSKTFPLIYLKVIHSTLL